jgi:membrane-associated protease RseP (regulator of RpoE activity)
MSKKGETVLGTPSFLGEGAYLAAPPPEQAPPRRPSLPWRAWRLPAVLYVATVATTWSVLGPAYSAALMTILTAHELGHFLQARRYGVPASPPYFIPMPLPPFGTMGAVIAMRSRTADRRALFDVAVSGPLAGLVPTLFFLALGLRLSDPSWGSRPEPLWLVGKPLLFQAFESLLVEAPQYGQTMHYHPIAVAAWTGLFITALNLVPIGQLDGGHILYTLLGRRAHWVSLALMATTGMAIASQSFLASRPSEWSVLWILLLLMGVRHPPTRDDSGALGAPRTFLGVASLLFVVVGFTPVPFGS